MEEKRSALLGNYIQQRADQPTNQLINQPTGRPTSHRQVTSDY